MLLHGRRHVSVYGVTLFGPTSVEDDANFASLYIYTYREQTLEAI
jgi:hypothetical protein